MSDILVAIGTVQGESALAGYEDQIEAVAMRHAVDLPVVSGGASRVEGASRHGAIELDHSLDIASPGLRQALSSGTNLGDVTITRMRVINGESRPAEIIILKGVYVTRVDLETPWDQESGAPADEPVESFSLEYSAISWEGKKYINGVESGSVVGAWSTVSQSTSV